MLAEIKIGGKKRAVTLFYSLVSCSQRVKIQRMDEIFFQLTLQAPSP